MREDSIFNKNLEKRKITIIKASSNIQNNKKTVLHHIKLVPILEQALMQLIPVRLNMKVLC